MIQDLEALRSAVMDTEDLIGSLARTIASAYDEDWEVLTRAMWTALRLKERLKKLDGTAK